MIYNYKMIKKIDKDIIQKNIDNLDINIKKKIKINYKPYGVVHESNYNKFIINKKYNKLEDIIKSSIINKKSYYEKCEKVIIDEYECIKLQKGLKIYRMIPGFLTNKKINKLIDNRSLLIYTFYSKYHAYNNIRLYYGGITCYEVIEDIYLIDYLNINNIKLIIEKIKNYKNSHYEKYIEEIKYSTGYDLTLKEHIEYLYKRNQDNSNIFVYDNVYPSNYYIYYKNVEYNKDLNPCNIYKDDISVINYIILYIFNYIINTNNKIDGLYIKQLFSHLSYNGIYNDECIYIKPQIQKTNIKFIIDNKLNWNNCKINNFDIQKYINVCPNIFLVNKYNGNQSNNYNFYLLKKIKDNQLSYKKVKEMLKDIVLTNNNILLYNINNLFSNNFFNKYNNTLDKLNKFIQKIDKYINYKLNYIILFGIHIYEKSYYDYLLIFLKNIGFIYNFNFNNEILILSKNMFNNDIINLDNDYIENKIIKLYNNDQVLKYFDYPYYDILFSFKKLRDISYININIDDNKISIINIIINKYLIKNKDNEESYNKYIEVKYEVINNIIKYIIDKSKPDILILNVLLDEKRIIEYLIEKNYKVYNDDNINIYIYSKRRIEKNIIIEYNNLFNTNPLLQSL